MYLFYWIFKIHLKDIKELERTMKLLEIHKGEKKFPNVV